MAALLGQAFHAATQFPDLLATVLGQSIDLLVWIPKTPDADEVHSMRPLQLPACLRRLFGAVVARTVGPAIEPCLTPDQAAIAGGHSGPNICRVFRHLEGPDGNGPEPGPLWAEVFDPHTAVIDDYINQTPSYGAEQAPAAVFADQNKAFERI